MGQGYALDIPALQEIAEGGVFKGSAKRVKGLAIIAYGDDGEVLTAHVAASDWSYRPGGKSRTTGKQYAGGFSLGMYSRAVPMLETPDGRIGWLNGKQIRIPDETSTKAAANPGTPFDPDEIPAERPKGQPKGIDRNAIALANLIAKGPSPELAAVMAAAGFKPAPTLAE